MPPTSNIDNGDSDLMEKAKQLIVEKEAIRGLQAEISSKRKATKALESEVLKKMALAGRDTLRIGDNAINLTRSIKVVCKSQ